MTLNALADLKVLAFDVFGTAVDWRTGVMTEMATIARERRLNVDPAEFAEAWRTRARPLMDRVSRGQMPFAVLDGLHRSALEELVPQFSLHLLSTADLDRLVRAWHQLPAWPDAIAGMSRLRSRFVLTTLSNGGMAMLVDLARAASLPFDCILSTELVKSYKPDPRTYQMVPSLLAVRPEQAMMVAAHPYDLAAAAEQGMHTAFVRRPHEWGSGKEERPDFPVDIVAADFLDLASQLEMAHDRTFASDERR
jgi:2-haloacid dehalogenase